MPGPWKQILHPINALRERVTDGLEVSVSDGTVVRGQGLDVSVTISDSTGLTNVEVGIVCTEYYACDVGSSQGGSSKGVSSAIARESWAAIEATPGVHTRRFDVPTGAPFSYRGDNLCFEWEVVARGARPHRLDLRTAHGFSVLP